MPLEETSWALLIIAAIAQRQGGDLSWLVPYWPAISTWYNFLITLLPFPQNQLSTGESRVRFPTPSHSADDHNQYNNLSIAEISISIAINFLLRHSVGGPRMFQSNERSPHPPSPPSPIADDFDGPINNATNLAIKGVAAIAAYGYIVEKATGNTTAAQEAYATAGSYAQTMVQYSWVNNGTNSHFTLGYLGSKGPDGDPASWPMVYNALWLRVLGLDGLVPQANLDSMRDFYVANKLQEYGLPLNSRKLYTKDDWMTFLAATYFTADATPAPSAFSTTLFHGLFRYANETTSREALSDWTNTDVPSSVGFTNRPVYGAMWAPMLVAQGASLGLGAAGNPNDSSLRTARQIFAEVWARDV
jgi:hypothetical protein